MKPTLETIDLVLEDREVICITLRRSSKARRARLSLSLKNQFILSIPQKWSTAKARRVVPSFRSWVAATVSKLAPPTSMKEWFQAHSTLCDIDGTVSVRIIEGAAAGPEVGDRWQNELVVFGTETEVISQLRSFAQIALKGRTARLADALAITNYKKVIVRDQKTRWGSCSSTGTISLNWRLLLLPPQNCDAIIIHELAHLREMNHGPSFYAYLKRLDPNYSEHERFLKLNGPTVMRLGRV